MTSRRAKIHRVALVFAAATTGCATAPEPLTALDDATAIVARARVEDAQRHAPMELRFAEAKLERARAAMSAKDHAGAARLLAQAEVDAELALVKTRQGRARAAADAKAAENEQLKREIGEESP